MKLSDFTLVKSYMIYLAYKDKLVLYIETEKNGEKHFFDCQNYTIKDTMKDLSEILSSDKIVDMLVDNIPDHFQRTMKAETYVKNHPEEFI